MKRRDSPAVKRRKSKNPHAVALGRKGGKKGGKARWAGISEGEASEIMRRVVQARWEGHEKATKAK